MKKITDEFQFGRYIESVREDAAGLPATQIDLIRKLGMLIEDALAEFAGEKFATPRSMGDLDAADGIQHLLDDYPPQVPPGKVFREAFLTTGEEAAARHLLKLYPARDSLNDGFGLPEESIREIEATGRELLTWRLHGPAFEHEKEKRAEKRGSSKGGKTKAEREAEKLAARDKKIINRAKQFVGIYAKTEALDILVREFSKRFKIGRKRISQIVSSVFPPKKPRAKSSD